jgi:hypothetical protein
VPRSTEGLKAASDVAKQIITLSTGVITVTIAFFDKIQGSSKNPGLHQLITWSWIIFGIGILCAVATLMGVTTSLDGIDQIDNGEKPAPVAPQKLPSAFDVWVVVPAVGMVIAFVLAMGLTIAAGILR